MTFAAQAPFLVALNLTHRCNPRCAHCYLDAGRVAAPQEAGSGRCSAAQPWTGEDRPCRQTTSCKPRPRLP